jgi:transposase
MTMEDQRRALVLTRLLAGASTVEEAATMLGLSLRQTWRLKARFAVEGPAALVHGNRGRVSARRIPGDVRERVLALARGGYAGINDSHLAELLAEREGIELSRVSLRRILRAAGLPSPRRRRAPRHRSRRDRMPQAGMLLQLDASRHDWLEGRGPRLTLLGAIDDATGQVTGAVFRDEEDAAGYLLLMRDVIARHGLPLAIYRDRAGAFEQPEGKQPDPELRLADGRRPTHVGRALRYLGVGSIAARSPQAKGRIERLWGTFQDRSRIELRLAGITDREGAQAFLAGYLPRHNGRFAIEPADPTAAWRPMAAGMALDDVLCFRYRRVVANDATVRIGGMVLDLPRQPGGRSLAGRRVDVRLRLDCRIVVSLVDRQLLVTGPVTDQARLRDLERARFSLPRPGPAAHPGYPPATSHPWRRATPGSALETTRRQEQGLTDSLTS